MPRCKLRTKSWNASTSGAARLSVCDDASTSVSEDNAVVHFLSRARPVKHHRETSPLIHLEDKNILTQVSLGCNQASRSNFLRSPSFVTMFRVEESTLKRINATVLSRWQCHGCLEKRQAECAERKTTSPTSLEDSAGSIFKDSRS